MGTPTSAGGAPNDIRDRTIRFLTLDLASEAFALRDADFTEDADGRAMTFWTNLLANLRLDLAAEGRAIIARTDDAADPLGEVGLFMVDARGQARWCVALLGTPDGESVVDEVTFKLTPDATYAALVSSNVALVEAVWEDLRGYVTNLGSTPAALDEDSSDQVRLAVRGYVQQPGFMTFNASRRPDSSGQSADPKRVPLALRNLFREPDQVADPYLVFMELMLRQAGAKLPPTMAEKLSASVFSTSFLTPLVKLLPERARASLTEKLMPGDDWDGDLVLASRPAVGWLYLVEFFVREMRRKRRNALWRDLGIAHWRGAAASVVYDTPTASAELAILSAATAAIPSLTDPVVRIFVVRDHCRWVRELVSDYVTSAGLAITDAALDATVTELRQRMLPHLGDEAIARERGADKIGLSPLYAPLLAVMEPRWSWSSGSSGHDCPAELRPPEVQYTPAEERLFEASRSYLYYCLYGVDLYYREYEGRSYESILEEDDLRRATVVKALLDQLRDLLDGCPVEALIREGMLRSDFVRLFIRLLDARQNVGGNWARPLPTAIAGTGTGMLETLNKVVKPLGEITGVLKSYYSGAVEGEVWRLIREAGGPAQEPATLVSKVSTFFKHVKTFMARFGDRSVAQKLAFSIGAQAVVDQVGKRVAVTLVRENESTQATLSTVVDLYVLKKQGAVGAWPDISQAQLATDVQELAAVASAKFLVVPAVLEGFASVVGLTVTLMSFDKNLTARKTTLGDIVVVGKVAEGVLSTTKSVFTATKVLLDAMPEGARPVIPLMKAGDGGLTYTRLASGAGGVATWVGKAAEGVGAVVAVAELADTFMDPGSGLNKARRVGDVQLTAAHYSKTGFLAVSAAAGLAGTLGLAGAAVTGPIGLVCAFAIIVIDARIADLETEYHKLVARGTQQFKENFAHRWSDPVAGEVVVSELTLGLHQLSAAALSFKRASP